MNTQQLRMGGERARQIISSTQSTLLDDRRKVLSAAVKDLLPNQEDIHGAVLEGCLFLLKIEANSGENSLGIATISSLASQLRRTYNDQTVLEAVCFAEGFLGIEESRSSPSRLEALQNHDPITSWERAGSTYSATESYTSTSRPDTQTTKTQGPQKLIVASSLLLAGIAVTLIGVTTHKVLDESKAPNGSNKNELGGTELEEKVPSHYSTTRDASPSSSALQERKSTFENLGHTVDDQELQLDLATVSLVEESTPKGLKIATAKLIYNDGDVLEGKFRVYCPTSQIRPIDFVLRSSSGVLKKEGAWWENSFAPKYAAERELVTKTCQ